jgi:hypothetical protein
MYITPEYEILSGQAQTDGKFTDMDTVNVGI